MSNMIIWKFHSDNWVTHDPLKVINQRSATGFVDIVLTCPCPVGVKSMNYRQTSNTKHTLVGTKMANLWQAITWTGDKPAPQQLCYLASMAVTKLHSVQ